MSRLVVHDATTQSVLQDTQDPAEIARTLAVIGVRFERWEVADLPAGARYAVDTVTADAGLVPALTRLLRKVAVVDDLAAARSLVAALPDTSAVTRDGDLLSSWFSTGGSSARPSSHRWRRRGCAVRQWTGRG